MESMRSTSNIPVEQRNSLPFDFFKHPALLPLRGRWIMDEDKRISKAETYALIGNTKWFIFHPCPIRVNDIPFRVVLTLHLVMMFTPVMRYRQCQHLSAGKMSSTARVAFMVLSAGKFSGKIGLEECLFSLGFSDWHRLRFGKPSESSSGTSSEQAVVLVPSVCLNTISNLETNDSILLVWGFACTISRRNSLDHILSMH
jgi:hypothetical protein